MNLVGDIFVGVLGNIGWAWDGERLVLGRVERFYGRPPRAEYFATYHRKRQANDPAYRARKGSKRGPAGDRTAYFAEYHARRQANDTGYRARKVAAGRAHRRGRAAS